MASRTVRCGSGRLQLAEDWWAWPDASPAYEAGALVLMSMAGTFGVKEMPVAPLSPLSSMAVSERLVTVGIQKGDGVGVGVGLRLGVANSQ